MTLSPRKDMEPPTAGGSDVAKTLQTGRAHGLWAQALQLQDRDGALRALDALGPAAEASAEDWRDPRTAAMRLWQAQTWLHQGRARESAQLLTLIERRSGQSAETRLLAAKQALFRNDFEACASASSEAVTLGGPDHDAFGPAYRLWAEALCLDGQKTRARRLLMRVLADIDPLTNPDMRSLRQTIETVDDLDEYCGFLSGHFDPARSTCRATLYHYAMACRDLGLYERATSAIRRRFLITVEAETYGVRAASPSKPEWVQDAAAAMRDFDAALKQAKTPFFLISGTLLGCVRSGGILGHDKDIDVGVMETPELDREAVHAALTGSGVFLVKPYEKPTLLRLQHASGVVIDLFWHRHEDGRVMHEGMKTKWWNTPFDLVSAPFLGGSYLIPDDHARYLGENYGDWQVVDPEFETFVDTPNMIVTNPDEMIWYYYAKLPDYYVLGKGAQFRKIFHELALARPDDMALRDVGYRVLALLEAGAD